MNTEQKEPSTDLIDPSRPNAISVAEKFNLVPKSLTEAMEYAKLIAKSEVCPKEYFDKPANILIAVQMGAELGVSPLQSLQSIAVINGRPSMWGDLVLALVKRSGLLEYIKEREPAECLEKGEGRCEVKRKGEKDPVVRTFTREMAQTAGLIDRAKGSGRGDGPWITYEGRMLQMRARSWALRDVFGDVLKGLTIREEQEDAIETTARVITMPRRIGEDEETQAGAVDAFLDEVTAGNQRPRSQGRTQPQGNGGSGPQTWVGVLRDIKTSSGKVKTGKNAGRPWTLHTAIGADGQSFGTFDEKMLDPLGCYVADRTEVEIAYETTERGNRNIIEIRPVPAAREPGEDE